MMKSAWMLVMSAAAIFSLANSALAVAPEDEPELDEEKMPGIHGADVLHPTCSIPTSPDLSTRIFTTDAVAVITPSGKVNLACHAELPPGTVEPFLLTGFPCRLGPAPETTESHLVWTPSGEATLTCHGALAD